MSLRDLLPKLLPGHPERETAARDLCRLVARLAVAVGVRPRRREQVASEVAYKILVSIESRAVERWRDPDAYVRRMVKNAEVDLGAAESAWQQLDEEDEPAAPEPGPPAEQLEEELTAERAAARELLGRVFDAHLAKAPARYRPQRERTFRQLCDLAFDGRDLHQLVIRDEQVAAHDTLAVERSLLRAYKAHERLRSALRKTIGALEEDRRLGAQEARRARDCLNLLIRAGVRRAGLAGLEDEGDPP